MTAARMFEIGTDLGTLPRLWAMMGSHLDHCLSETQAWKSHPAQPWPCFSSAQSFVHLWPGIQGPCALAGLTTMVPTAHTLCSGIRRTPFPKGGLCPPASMSLLTRFLPTIYFNHIHPSGHHSNAKHHLLQGAFHDCHTMSTLDLSITHPSPWEAE